MNGKREGGGGGWKKENKGVREQVEKEVVTTHKLTNNFFLISPLLRMAAIRWS